VSSDQRSIEGLQSTFDTNTFVMMRYRDTPQFQAIERSLRSTLSRYGLRARLAKDRALSADLWDNICLYMTSSRYGIAVFEELDEREFNPNISLELGYMYALGRRCLLLKEKRMPLLPTDTLGKIYRNFDAFDLERTIERQVSGWCKDDLGLNPAFTSPVASSAGEAVFEHVEYDSASDRNFSGWGMFDTTLNFARHIRVVSGTSHADGPGSSQALEIRAAGNEAVGVNRKVEALHGEFVTEYCAISSRAKSLNLFLCVIPMQEPIGGLTEVGTQRVDAPENAHSPYRVRRYVQHHEVDGAWRTARLEFDFRQTPTAAYAICAARVNEGCPSPGPGVLRIRNARVLT